jgi:N-acetylmuramic acid 6-phosphate etherase
MAARRTEAQHVHARGLQAEAPPTVLARLLDGQRAAAAAVEAALPALADAAAAAAEALGAGHRLAYAGAGSSGLMALADALELAGTFGIPADRTPVLFAGGAAALLRMTGAVEDDAGAAAAEVARAGLGAGDAVIAVSASGSTPYTVAVAEAARARGAAVIGVANAAGSRLLALAGFPVLLDTGPELVAGSTRMGAATAQKIALNMLSTLVGVRLGHVHDGFMVNVVADNRKLRERAAGIVAAVSGAGDAAARAALEAADGAVKPAVLLAAGARDRAGAEQLLAASGGHLGPALDALRSARQTGAEGPPIRETTR